MAKVAIIRPIFSLYGYFGDITEIQEEMYAFLVKSSTNMDKLVIIALNPSRVTRAEGFVSDGETNGTRFETRNPGQT